MIPLSNNASEWLERASEGSVDRKQAHRIISFDDDIIGPEHLEIELVNIRGYNRVSRTLLLISR